MAFVLIACVVQGYSRDRSEMYLYLHSSRSEFMPVWIHAGLKSVGSVQQVEWLETSPSYFRPGLM
jgi:hypothetical protein